MSTSSTICASFPQEREFLLSLAIPEIPSPSCDKSPSLPSVEDPRLVLQKLLIILPHRLMVSESVLLLRSVLFDLVNVCFNDKDARLPLLPGRASADVPIKRSGEILLEK